jgi:AcrR family transcriptional regulator
MRLTAEQRHAQIVAAAHGLSAEGGLYEWTLDDVATMVGCSRSAVRHYFTSAKALRDRVITDAIERRDLDICVQALAKYDPLRENMTPHLKRAAAAHLAT